MPYRTVFVSSGPQPLGAVRGILRPHVGEEAQVIVTSFAGAASFDYGRLTTAGAGVDLTPGRFTTQNPVPLDVRLARRAAYRQEGQHLLEESVRSYEVRVRSV